MVYKCPSGTENTCRVVTSKKKKVKVRLCGCAKKGKFIKNGVKEAKKLKK